MNNGVEMLNALGWGMAIAITVALIIKGFASAQEYKPFTKKWFVDVICFVPMDI